MAAMSSTGVPVAEIEAFAHLVGRNERSFFRLGYGFSRQRNGAVNMQLESRNPSNVYAEPNQFVSQNAQREFVDQSSYQRTNLGDDIGLDAFRRLVKNQ